MPSEIKAIVDNWKPFSKQKETHIDNEMRTLYAEIIISQKGNANVISHNK